MPLDIEDPADLTTFLRRRGLDVDGARFDRLAGGVSNRTVLVSWADGHAWVLKQALARLRVAGDWRCSPERVHREALGGRWLGAHCPPGAVPRIVLEDEDEHLLAMDAVPRPHENWKAMLLTGGVEAEHVRQFGALLAVIHRSTAEVPDAFGDWTYFEALRLEPYYLYTAQEVPAAAGFLEALVADTRATRATVVHGDYSPKNVLVHRGRLVLLDHEVIHFGDPGFDVGFALAHLLSKAHHLVGARDRLAEAAHTFWESYDRADGESRAARHALGCTLARVAGRSPLEYLDARERARQQAAVLALMERPPATVPATIDGFLERIA